MASGNKNECGYVTLTYTPAIIGSDSFNLARCSADETFLMPTYSVVAVVLLRRELDHIDVVCVDDDQLCVGRSGNYR